MIVKSTRRRAGTLAAIALAFLVGCTKRTVGVTAASARPGEIGFGAAIHMRGVNAGVASTSTTTAGIGQAAIVDREPPPGSPGDALWQVHGAGQKIRHCTVLPDGSHACAAAQLPERKVQGTLLILDPVNLGRYVTITRYSGAGYGSYVHSSGTRIFTGDAATALPSERKSRSRSRLPATKTHGIWVRQDNDVKPPWHCQLEESGPVCRSLPGVSAPFVGQVFFNDGVMGLMTIDEVDILWLSQGSRIIRCAASRAQPDPSCQAAEMR
jgi:hypothetical protein